MLSKFSVFATVATLAAMANAQLQVLSPGGANLWWGTSSYLIWQRWTRFRGGWVLICLIHRSCFVLEHPPLELPAISGPKLHYRVRGNFAIHPVLY